MARSAHPDGEKHHYLPVFYLKQWAGKDGRLCEFSRPYKNVKPKFQGGNALVRESDHAKYEVDYVTIEPGKLHQGENTITLVQSNMKSDQASINYDYINLELP